MIVGDGGAPAVVMRSGCSTPCLFDIGDHVADCRSPQRLVTPRSWMTAQKDAGRTARRQTWIPLAAVTAKGVHQPFQWKRGRV